jgi:hypothetical protein
MLRRTRPALLALLLALALGLAACGGSDGSAGSETTQAPAQAGGMETGEHEMPAGGDVMSPAADLRVALDSLLGEHAMLAIFATQKGYAGDEDFEAIAKALDENSVELSEAIGSVYGTEAAKEFLDGRLLWRDHIGFFVDYTVGLATKDNAKQRMAVDRLMAYNARSAAFFASATGLPIKALLDGVAEHISQLKGQIDAYAKEDYDSAYDLVREAYGHMYMTGDTLAGAIAAQSPDEFPLEPATQSAGDLRVTLDRLLGEHAILAMIATQKGLDGDADFETVAAALDENSVEVAEAIGSVYGEKAGKQFLDGQNMWRDHIGFFVDYTVGLATNDKAAQEKAVGDLKGYIETSSAFLSQATGLPRAALREAVTGHVTDLKGQIDAYAAGDYERAHSLFRRAYEHMVMTGDTLAGAIVKQNPEMFSE